MDGVRKVVVEAMSSPSSRLAAYIQVEQNYNAALFLLVLSIPSSMSSDGAWE